MENTITIECANGSMIGVRRDKYGHIHFIFVPSGDEYKAIVYKTEIDKLINFLKNAK